MALAFGFSTLGIDVWIAERLGFLAAMTLAASFGFTLPVASPPNAVALNSGQITTGELARAGLPMNLLGVVLVTIACYTLVPLIFGR